MAKKKKVSTGAIIALCLLCVLVGVIAGAEVNVFLICPPSMSIPKTKSVGAVAGEIDVQSVLEEDLSIHFMMLGNKYNGDSIFIKAGENDILVDAGSRVASVTTISNYINQYCSDRKLEYVIVTHADRDHIAAFATKDGIFARYEVETIIDFAKTSKADQDTCKKYFKYRDEENAKHYTAYDCYYEQNGGQRVFELTDNIELEILYNYYYSNESAHENNYSVCFMINQKVGEETRHYFFTGDLEKEGEEKMVEYYTNGQNGSLPSEVALYKAGHHGSKTSSSLDLLDIIKPKVCVVECVAGSDEFAKDNPRNTFPTQTFINNISNYTTQVYVTTQTSDNEEEFKALNGNIVYCYTNREVIYCSESSSELKDSEWFTHAVANDLRDLPDAWKEKA